MAAKQSGGLGKILSTLFTSLVAPFLVGLALQDRHEGNGQPPQGEPTGTLDTPFFSESRYTALPAPTPQEIKSGSILRPTLRYLLGRAVLPLLGTETRGSVPGFSGGEPAAEGRSAPMPLTSSLPKGTRQADPGWNRPLLATPEQ
jgi:hypothetical protein